MRKDEQNMHPSMVEHQTLATIQFQGAMFPEIQICNNKFTVSWGPSYSHVNGCFSVKNPTHKIMTHIYNNDLNLSGTNLSTPDDCPNMSQCSCLEVRGRGVTA